jgi:hypothetical protein
VTSYQNYHTHAQMVDNQRPFQKEEYLQKKQNTLLMIIETTNQVPKHLMLDLDENNDHFQFDILPVAYIQVYLECFIRI